MTSRPPGTPRRRSRRLEAPVLALAGAVALLAGCTSGGGSGSGTVSGTASGTTQPAPERPQGPTGKWVLAGSDDFTGTSLDRQLWQPNRFGNDSADAPFNPDGEDAWFSPENVKVAGGTLDLTLKKQAKTLNGIAYHYNSGTVQSAPGQLVRSGSYVEARIKVPKCTGCWPAFWAVPPTTWPPEIDIMEYFNTAAESRPSFNYIDPAGGKTGPTPYGETGVDHRDGYHVYGMLWEGSTLTPYLDGVAYPSVTAKGLSPDEGMALILNLSVARGTQPDAGTTMQVDWVHVWNRGS